MVLLVYLLAEAELASTDVLNDTFWTNTTDLATSDIDLGVVEFLQTYLELALLQSSVLHLTPLPYFVINAG